MMTAALTDIGFGSLAPTCVAFLDPIAQSAPADCTVIGYENYIFSDALKLGFNGAGTNVFFSTDPLAAPAPVPLPTPLLLFGSAAGVLPSARRRVRERGRARS